MRRNFCRCVISWQEPLPHSLWISLDPHDILAIVWTPAYSVVSICVCWPPKRRVHNITSSSLLHRKHPLLFCCLLKVSQYRRALIDTASVHVVKGISQHIHSILYGLTFGKEGRRAMSYISVTGVIDASNSSHVSLCTY